MLSGGLTVVKVGGNEIDDAAWLSSLAAALADATAPVVLVHGGGKEVSVLQTALGLPTEWRDGLRVTTPETLRVVSMVLSGVVNKRVVGALLDAGVEAVGLSGEDGVVLAEPARDGALGRVGSVVEVRPRVLTALLDLGVVPVLSPVSRGVDGASLNVNADDVAVAVAVALGAARLLFVSNVPGVLAGGTVVGRIDADAVEAGVAIGTIEAGMTPKLRSAVRASAAGVADVRVGGLGLLAGVPGTRVLAAPAVVA